MICKNDWRRRRRCCDAERTRLIDLPGGGFRIVLTPDPSQTLRVIAFLSAAGAIGAGLLYAAHWLNELGPVRFRCSGPNLYLDGCWLEPASLVTAVLGLLRLVNGPERELILETSPGKLHIDQYVSSDHLVRDLSADEIRLVFVDVAIGIQTRTNTWSMAMSTPLEVQVAVAEFIGIYLWGDLSLVVYDVELPGTARGRAEVVIQSLSVAAECGRSASACRLPSGSSKSSAMKFLQLGLRTAHASSDIE